MTHTLDQLHEIQMQFTRELTLSSQGQTTSLPFIVHPLATQPLVGLNEQFQVLVIGGTVYKSALLTKNEKRISIIEQTSGPLPMFDTKKTFLSFITTIIDPRVSVVGCNFAYPVNPRFDRNYLDGVLICGTKEHAFSGLCGELVGQTTELFLQEHGRTVKIVIANDTICLLLSGLTQYNKSRLVGGVIGSGLNFAIFLGDNAAVNLESANFDKFSSSDEAKGIDRNSQNPGKALFEKETSGVYLYQLFNERVKQLEVQNVIPAPISIGVNSGRNDVFITSTDQLDQLARAEEKPLQEIAQEFIICSAQLVSCQIAGIADFYGHDTTFVMEGSLFWRGWKYKETIEQTVGQLTTHIVSFVQIPDSSILGAAKLVA